MEIFLSLFLAHASLDPLGISVHFPGPSASICLFSHLLPAVSAKFLEEELTIRSILSLLVLPCSLPVAEHKPFNLSALIFVACKMVKIIFSSCHERNQYLSLINRMYNPRYRTWAFILLPSKSMQNSH